MTNLTPDDLRALHAHLAAQSPEVQEQIQAARETLEQMRGLGPAGSMELLHALGRCLNGWTGKVRRTSSRK